MMKKPNYPIIVMLARDWNLYKDAYDENEVRTFTIAWAWIAGWLIDETRDSFIVAAENFIHEGNYFRYAQVIPKENVRFHHIIDLEKHTLIDWKSLEGKEKIKGVKE